jgi:septation ring formation regulator EzrA
MDKQISNEISPETFQNCGQSIYDRNISHTYNLIEKKTFEKQFEYLMSELCLVNDEISHLKSNINELTSKYYLGTKVSTNTSNIMFLRNSYGINFFKIKQTVKKIKEQLRNKENERNFLLLDIETTEKHIEEVKSKMKNYFDEY